MVLCTRIYIFISFRILNMKRKDIKSKALSSCFSGKLILLPLGGERFEPCLFPFVCTQIFLGHYFHYILILYLRLSFSLTCECTWVTITPFTLHLLDFVHSIQFSRHCQKSSRHSPPPNRTSSGTCREKTVRFRQMGSIVSLYFLQTLPCILQLQITFPLCHCLSLGSYIGSRTRLPKSLERVWRITLGLLLLRSPSCAILLLCPSYQP